MFSAAAVSKHEPAESEHDETVKLSRCLKETEEIQSEETEVLRAEHTDINLSQVSCTDVSSVSVLDADG